MQVERVYKETIPMEEYVNAPVTEIQMVSYALVKVKLTIKMSLNQTNLSSIQGQVMVSKLNLNNKIKVRLL